MANKQKSGKRSMGSRRAQVGLVAKAGRRRPPHIVSERDARGKRQWRAA